MSSLWRQGKVGKLAEIYDVLCICIRLPRILSTNEQEQWLRPGLLQAVLTGEGKLDKDGVRGQLLSKQKSSQLQNDTTIPVIPLNGLVTSSDEFYPTVAINALVCQLRDSKMASYHSDVVSALMFIFRSLQIGSVQYLPQVLPVMFQIIHVSDEALQVRGPRGAMSRPECNMWVLNRLFCVNMVMYHNCTYVILWTQAGLLCYHEVCFYMVTVGIPKYSTRLYLGVNVPENRWKHLHFRWEETTVCRWQFSGSW